MGSDESPAEGQDGLGSKRNVLRAGVLGVNDGLVSTAGLVIGVAGATNSTKALLTAGLAGLLAGSLSLAAGEYVSVSSHRDSERAALDHERRQLTDAPRMSSPSSQACTRRGGCPRSWPGRWPCI